MNTYVAEDIWIWADMGIVVVRANTITEAKEAVKKNFRKNSRVAEEICDALRLLKREEVIYVYGGTTNEYN